MDIPGSSKIFVSSSNPLNLRPILQSVYFEWRDEGSVVALTGTFNKWGKGIPMERRNVKELLLPPGVYHFKFIVDGDWKYDVERSFAEDSFGNINNVVKVLSSGDSSSSPPNRMVIADPAAIEEELQRVDHADQMEYGLPAQTLHPGCGFGSTTAGSKTMPRVHSFGSLLAEGVNALALTAKTEHFGGDMISVTTRAPSEAFALPPPPLLTPLSRPLPALREASGLEIDTGADASFVAPTTARGKLLIAMVGLPARCKTFIAKIIARHQAWMGYRTAVFTVDDYRRRALGAGPCASFYDPHSPSEVAALRGACIDLAWADMMAAFDPAAASGARSSSESKASDGGGGGIDIAIFDDNNTTRSARRALAERVATGREGLQLMFIESAVSDASILASNLHEINLRCPDYADAEEGTALADFNARIAHCLTAGYDSFGTPAATAIARPPGPLLAAATEADEAAEVTAEDASLSYIKLVDVGRQILSNNVRGYVPSRILLLLANLHLTPRPIWLSRHGESEYNLLGRVGGDSALSPLGRRYAAELAAFMAERYPAPSGKSTSSGVDSCSGDGSAGHSNLMVWTSTMLRTSQTVSAMERGERRGGIGPARSVSRWKQLDEIDAGVCDGMTYPEIAAKYPEEYAARKRHKLQYRYPRGESYQDVIHRLEPVMLEIMRQPGPLLIVAHQAILRMIYGYLTRREPAACPALNMPLHTVIQLTPKAYGCEEVWHYPMGKDCAVAHDNT